MALEAALAALLMVSIMLSGLEGIELSCVPCVFLAGYSVLVYFRRAKLSIQIQGHQRGVGIILMPSAFLERSPQLPHPVDIHSQAGKTMEKVT